jgi:hypothetical protein
MADLNTILTSLKAGRTRTAWFVPVDDQGKPFGDPPFRIHLLSRRSDEWRQMENAWQMERAVQMANNGKVTAQDATKYVTHLVRSHIAITREWENLETAEGEPVPCTPVTMQNLYNDIDFREQLFAFTADPANYGEKGDIEPSSEAEDAQKKLLNGVSGDSPGASTSV